MAYKKFLAYLLEITLITIAIIMILGTFIPQKRPAQFYMINYPHPVAKLILYLGLDDFYASAVNIGLWLAFTLLLSIFIVSGIFKRKSLFILHTIIFLIALTVFCDKIFNKQYFLEIREGESINLGKFLNDDSEKYDFEFTLLDFSINYHKSSQMPSAFVSEVRLKNNVKKKIKVNKPLTIGNYKFYQSSYDILERFIVEIDSVPHIYIKGDTLITDSLVIRVIETPNGQKSVNIILNEKPYRLTENIVYNLLGHNIRLIRSSPIYSSGLQISRVYCMKPLFVLAILFIIALGWNFWGKGI